MSEAEYSDKNERWRLDKKVPIQILIVLASQFLWGLWVLAEMRKDIEFLKVQVIEQRQRDDKQDKGGADSLALMRSQLDRIEANQYRMAKQRGMK